MSTEPQDRLADAFDAVREMASPERDRVLRERFNDAPDLMIEVKRLLEAHDRNRAGFLETPALGAGFSVTRIASEPEPLPERIGPYRVLALLSESDTALVYEGEQETPVHRRVVIKVLRSASQRREVLRRFEAERQTLARMEHPNIARLYEAGTTGDGRAYFAMEHAGGQPITAFASALPVRERLGIFVQVCRGVEHAHIQGIIHRDLKPSNILVSRADEGSQAKVIDFGVAKAVGESARLTLTGHLMGTPAYMSPEQLSGKGARVDTRSDVYALGVVFFEVLGARPAFDFEALGPASGVAAISSGEVPPLRKIAPEVPRDVALIVSQAMQVDPQHRYQSVRELRLDIERYLEGRAISARGRRPLYEGWMFLMRNRVAALLVMMVVAVCAGAVVYARRAERQQYRKATELARGLLGQVVSMSRTVGLRSQRAPLVQGLLTETERIFAFDPNDWTLMAMRAEVLCAAGDVAQERGRLPEAGILLADALSLRERLAQREGAGLSEQMDLSVAIVRLGDVAKDEGDMGGAVARYTRAMQMDQLNVARAPRNVRAQTLLAWSYERMGSMYARRQRMKEALKMQERFLGVMLSLHERTRDVDVERGTAVAYRQCAAIHQDEGRVAESRELTRKAIEHAREAVAIAPDNQLAHRVLVGSLIALATVGGDQMDKVERTRLVEDAMTGAEELRRLDPEDPDSLSLAASAGCFAMMDAFQRGELERSVTYYTRSLSAAKRLAYLSPGPESSVLLRNTCDNAVPLLQAAKERGLVVSEE